MSDQSTDFQGETLADKLEKDGPQRVDFSRQPRKFAAVMEEIAPQGEKTKIKDLEGQEITIHSLRFFSGRYGKAVFVIFTDSGGALYNMVLSQKVIVPKLAAVRDELPLTGTIVKVDAGDGKSYWDIQ